MIVAKQDGAVISPTCLAPRHHLNVANMAGSEPPPHVPMGVAIVVGLVAAFVQSLGEKRRWFNFHCIATRQLIKPTDLAPKV
jgi:hypothetical protein